MDKILNGLLLFGEIYGQEILYDLVYSDGGYILQIDLSNYYEEDNGIDFEGY